MPKFYLNSYAPLIASKVGREASARYDIPPFVDGSIRREPDLEHPNPAITCLCRGRNFAPRLRPGDVVFYSTKKARYGQDHSQRRLTAVLRVLEVFPNHNAGSSWYIERNLRLPNNCLLRGNPAKPLRESHRITREGGCSTSEIHKAWDTAYRGRAMLYGTFVVCKRIWNDLSWDAPEITDQHLMKVYGRMISTFNPGAWEIKHAQRLLRLLKKDVPLSDQ